MSDQEQEPYYIQSLTVDDREIPIDSVYSSTYIENITMEGSKLILKLDDLAGFIKDDLGCAVGSVVTVHFSPAQTNANFKESFVVLSMPNDAGHLVLNCEQSQSNVLKQRVIKQLFIHNNLPNDALKILAGGLSINGSIDGAECSYSVNIGSTHNRMITSLGNDHACAIWVMRGALHVASYATLESDRPVITLSDEVVTPFTARILDIKYTDYSYSYDRTLNKKYCGWSITGGAITGGNDSGVPQIMEAVTAKHLANRIKYLLPLAELTIGGNDDIKVGDVVQLAMSRQFEEDETLEALPKNVIVMRACHHYMEGVFKTLLIVGVVSNAK